MAIEFTSNPTKWENEGAEPSEELKKNGFQAGYKPPAGVFNHHWHETAECIGELQTKVSDIDDNKVDKVTGKGLSKNDFTDDYKAKLDNLDTNISETLAGKADKTEVLTKTNTAAFTPTADYQPATKKYVDDNKTQIADNLTTEDSGKALSAKQGKILNTNKVDKVSGKGLSANDYTDAEKAEVAKVKDKVDKVSGKGLSTNDFTSAYKTKLDNLDTNLSGKVDKITGKGLSTNDYTNAEKAEVAKIKDKVDKATGKGLSTNDFTAAYKTKLDNLDTNLNAKAPAYSYSTTDLTAGTSALATGKLYFVYE